MMNIYYWCPLNFFLCINRVRVCQNDGAEKVPPPSLLELGG